MTYTSLFSSPNKIRVNNLNFSDDKLSLDLAVVESSWKDAFSRFDIDFGHTTDTHIFRRHADFFKIRRRQEPTVSILPVAIPSDTPDDVVTASFDLSSQLIDKTFEPGDFLSGIADALAIPDLPIEVGCKNCSTAGTLVLTQGAINIDLQQVDVIPDFLQGGDDGKDLTSVITGGFFQLTANNVGAHIELFARPKVSGAFEIALLPLPIVGFTIPNIGRAGVTFEPTLQVSYEVSGGIEINHGFDIAVPDKSNVKIELTDVGKSAVVGFPDTTLQPLPFSANVSDIEALVSLAFRPTIPIGFKFLEQFEASIEIFMDLPKLDAKLSTKANADPNCETLPAENTTTSAPPYANSTANSTSSLTAPNAESVPAFQLPGLLSQIGPLVLVEANVSINVGVSAAFQFPVLPPPANKIEKEVNIFETTFTLATTCLAAGQGYKTATDVWNSMAGGYNATIYSKPPTISTTAGSYNATVYANPPTITVLGGSSSSVHAASSTTTTEECSTSITSVHVGMTESKGCDCTPSTTTVYITATPAHVTSLPPPVASSPPPEFSLPPPVLPPISQSPPPSLPPPAVSPPPFVLNTTSILAPSGTEGVPQQSGPPAQFTGAATPGALAPFVWRHVGWQFAVLMLSTIAGAMILL